MRIMVEDASLKYTCRQRQGIASLEMMQQCHMRWYRCTARMARDLRRSVTTRTRATAGSLGVQEGRSFVCLRCITTNERAQAWRILTWDQRRIRIDSASNCEGRRMVSNMTGSDIRRYCMALRVHEHAEAGTQSEQEPSTARNKYM